MSAAGVDLSIVDLKKLADWMDDQELLGGAIEDVEVLAGGTQNVLLRFSRGGRTFVLRRPPPHPREKSNETMRREARVLSAIAESDVPHPRLIAACSETEPIGASFYLMEPIEGFNPTQGMPEYHSGDPEIRSAVIRALTDKSGRVRRGALKGLRASDAEEVGKIIADILSTDDLSRRMEGEVDELFKSLARIADERIAEAMVAFTGATGLGARFRKPSPLQAKCTRALRRMNGPEARPVIARFRAKAPRVYRDLRETGFGSL